ncbi:MAG: flagellar hook-associated protein FlgL, partial [Chromatiales bacterium]|nr:flagellar hook-associated protein FlgL [Chromatiales bacterium]
MLRISTQMIYDRSVSAMLKQQNDVANTQLQLSTGRRVLTAADDPASAARVLDLNGALETTRQYMNNADRARARLETEEGVLSSVTNLLQRVSELAVQGNNDHLTDTDRDSIATELRQLEDQLFGLANTRDSNGEYIFSGFQSNTRPFSHVSGVYSYNGDLGSRELQISADRQLSDGDNGFDVFMDIPTVPISTVN